MKNLIGYDYEVHIINALAEVMGFTAFHSNIDIFFVGGGKSMGQKA